MPSVDNALNAAKFCAKPTDAMAKAIRDAMLSFMSAMAEAQALAMKEAQSAGIAHAKAIKPDSYKGRKPSYTAAQVSLIMQKFKEGDGVNKIARDVGLSKFSVSRITRDPDKALESLSRWS